LQLFGRGWGALGLDGRVESEYVPNDLLGELYSSLRFTLNDHWQDMAEFGFVNNRIFDALACGLPVISDRHDELVSLFPKGIAYCSDSDSFEKCLRDLLIDYVEVFEIVRGLRETIEREFSFDTRCDQLLEALGSATPNDG
jgi:spore maturation protein CgeB